MTTALTNAPAVANGMMSEHGETSVVESLRPVRDALLADAGAEADRLVADARRRADQRIADVEEDVEAEVADVERRAQMSAMARAAHASARARTESHRSMMRRRTDTERELAVAIQTAIQALRDDARYPDLLRHFEVRAREQLGSEARVTIDSDGGVIATVGSRRVDYTLTALADRALASLADEVAALWT
jgi:vacuolar-type H+-ATPase subunit E/Vma4